MPYNRIQRIRTLKRQLEIVRSQQVEVQKIPIRGAESTTALRKQNIALDLKAALIQGELNSIQ